jgi:AcrR family transcriptional regulator
MYETAAKLFAERGFAGTSLQDIADAMGITRPALYYYVKSKDDLLAKLVAEFTESATSAILKVANQVGAEPVEKLSRIAHMMAYERAVHPMQFLLLERSESNLSADLATVNNENKRATLRTMVELVEDGIAAGQFRPVNPRSAALAVIGMCNWVAWWFHDGESSKADQVASDIADMAVASLVASPERVSAATGPRAAVELLRQDLAYLERLIDESEAPPRTRRGKRE